MIAGKMAVENKNEPEEFEEDSFWKSPLIWGGVITVLYFAGFSAFLYFFGNYPCDGLTLNEVGDFFAGLAGPLAFIWLVVAVIVQSRELSAQRKTLIQQMEELKLGREELKLNRKEYQLNREVLMEQASSIKAQTDIEMRSEKKREIDIQIDNLYSELAKETCEVRVQSDPGHGNNPFRSDYDKLKHTLSPIKLLEFFIKKLVLIANDHRTMTQFGAFRSLIEKLDNIIDLKDELAPDYEQYDFSKLKEKLVLVIKKQKEFEKINP